MEPERIGVRWLAGWVVAIVKAFKLIRKYGVRGAEDHAAREMGKLRMEYFKETGRPWKGKQR